MEQQLVNKSDAMQLVQNIANDMLKNATDLAPEWAEQLEKIKNAQIQPLYKAFALFASQLQAYLNNQKHDKDFILQGTALLFQFRTYLTNNEISFMIGGTAAGQQLKERHISQNELFGVETSLNNLILEDGAIRLAKELTYLSSMQNAQTNLSERWKAILNYGFIKGANDNTAEKLSDGDDNVFYHKKERDINVYMKYTTEAKRIYMLHYYFIKGAPKNRDDLNQGIFYNKGWMYQWLHASPDFELNEKSKTPLLPLMSMKTSRMENIQGLRGGDVGDTQLKFGNKKIISVHNMLQVITGEKGILSALSKLASNDKIKAQEAMQDLLSLFTMNNQNEIANAIETGAASLNLTLFPT